MNPFSFIWTWIYKVLQNTALQMQQIRHYTFKQEKRNTLLYVRDSLSVAKSQNLSFFILANCHTRLDLKADSCAQRVTLVLPL